MHMLLCSALEDYHLTILQGIVNCQYHSGMKKKCKNLSVQKQLATSPESNKLSQKKTKQKQQNVGFFWGFFWSTVVTPWDLKICKGSENIDNFCM